MLRRLRPPLWIVAAILLGLIATLAVLQYRWLGQISAAEHDRMRSSLAARATDFAHDFDRELTRAYLLFQLDVPHERVSLDERFAMRYDHWQATSRYPKLIAEYYVARRAELGAMTLERYDPVVRRLVPAAWPAAMAEWRAQLPDPQLSHGRGVVTVRRLTSPIWESVPALVVPSPVMIVTARGRIPDMRVPPLVAYTILTIDRDYVAKEMLPALARRHFNDPTRLHERHSLKGDAGGDRSEERPGDDVEYQLAVVARSERDDVIYRSTEAFVPRRDAQADAAADLFQLRIQEFGSLAAEVRRFTTFVAATRAPSGAGREIRHQLEFRSPSQLSIVVQDVKRGAPPAASSAPAGPGTAVGMGAAAGGELPAASASAPRWRLLVKHPAGSLEAAVSKVRRRNLAISSSVLLLLAASLVMITVSSQRAQRLAAQQMEFVAAVSHELRTPLAVIRSAGENLADGVIRDEQQIRKYGDLVRNEGRRLTEMVEQTLELAGIQSGQRGFALRPIRVRSLIDDVLESAGSLVEDAGVRVEIEIPETLPPVLGDEPALRRVFQNLIANAIKYGERGRWLGVRADAAGREVIVSVSDRGIGIAPAEQARIFEPFYRTPDVVAAQIHGAGLGLSVVKRIVEAHGGRISVRSAPGQGSEFIVRLPAAEQEPIIEARLHSRGEAEAPILKS
jgi:two-component system sensor histidine kinase SenX3